MKKRMLKQILIVSLMAVFLLTASGCNAAGIPGINKEKLQWAMVPDTDIYCAVWGEEPADAYAELWYDYNLGVYRIDYPETQYLTPEGEPITANTPGYEHLHGLPLVQENHEEGYDYYTYIDGSQAFGGKRFQHASAFYGDYAEVRQKDWKPTLIDREGNIVYQAKNKHAELFPLKGDLFGESINHVTRIFNVKTGETIRTVDSEFVNKTSDGYILWDNEQEKQYLTDENFAPRWGGKRFTSLSEIEPGLYNIVSGDGGEIYCTADEKIILEVENGHVAIPGDGKILVYTPEELRCYNYKGEKLFTKEMEKRIVPVSKDAITGFAAGLAGVTLDGEKFGIIDEEGNMLAKCVFRYAKAQPDGTVMISYDRKAGILKRAE